MKPNCQLVIFFFTFYGKIALGPISYAAKMLAAVRSMAKTFTVKSPRKRTASGARERPELDGLAEWAHEHFWGSTSWCEPPGKPGLPGPIAVD